jgi:ribosomal protein S6
MKDEELKTEVERVEKEITRLNGRMVGTELIGRRSFARTMQKKEAGVYARLGFEMDPAATSALLARFRLNEGIFRIQLTRVKEPMAAVAERPNVDAAGGPGSAGA